MGEVVIKVKDEKGQEVEQKLDDAAVAKLVEEHSGLKGRAAEALSRAEKLKAVEDYAAKHGVSPEELVANADGAFLVINKLIEEEVIDPTGKVVGKKEGKIPKEKEPASGDTDLDALLKGDTKGLTGEAKLMGIVAKALEPTLKSLGKTIDEITTVQTGMLRNQWEQKIQGTFTNLDGDDVKKVFSEAAVKPKEGLLEIAKRHSEAKSKAMEELRKKHAAEFGINLEEFDANKLTEKGSEGGAAVMFQGKGFTLSKRREGKDRVDPTKATREYFRRTGVIR